jgi:hypothetical protein
MCFIAKRQRRRLEGSNALGRRGKLFVGRQLPDGPACLQAGVPYTVLMSAQAPEAQAASPPVPSPSHGSLSQLPLESLPAPLFLPLVSLRYYFQHPSRQHTS